LRLRYPVASSSRPRVPPPGPVQEPFREQYTGLLRGKPPFQSLHQAFRLPPTRPRSALRTSTCKDFSPRVTPGPRGLAPTTFYPRKSACFKEADLLSRFRPRLLRLKRSCICPCVSRVGMCLTPGTSEEPLVSRLHETGY